MLIFFRLPSLSLRGKQAGGIDVFGFRPPDGDVSYRTEPAGFSLFSERSAIFRRRRHCTFVSLYHRFPGKATDILRGRAPAVRQNPPVSSGTGGFCVFFFAGRSIHEAVARGVQDLLRLFAEFLFQEDIIRVVGRDCENRNFVFREDGGDF